MNERHTTCEQRIDRHLRSRIEDIQKLWGAYCEGSEEVEDLGTLHEYGLCFDYVASDTFEGQKESYFRYQLSWGGPSDEFRFYTNPDFSCHRIEYWFLDWFDGAHRTLSGADEAMISELWIWLWECEAPQAAFNKTRYH